MNIQIKSTADFVTQITLFAVSGIITLYSMAFTANYIWTAMFDWSYVTLLPTIFTLTFLIYVALNSTFNRGDTE